MLEKLRHLLSECSEQLCFAEFEKISIEEKRVFFSEFYECFGKFSEACGFGDPFNYSRGKEILMSCAMGHTIAHTYIKEDAIDDSGMKVEYKSTIGKRIQGTYNGISVFDNWEDQRRYLREEKIGKYKKHFFARFENSRIVELYCMDSDDVLSLLEEKIQKAFNKVSCRKDPRLGATITQREIYKFGKRVL